MIGLFTTAAYAQDDRNDKATFKPWSNDFYKGIKKDLTEFNTEDKEEKKYFKMDHTGIDMPTSMDGFTKVWSFEPESQGRTGTCWCFSTMSFYESEVKRISNKEIPLSELYVVYHEYIEKAREYIQTRGKSFFGEGSETNAVARMMDKYGIVPAQDYTGLKIGQPYHDHKQMFAEMKGYLHNLKKTNAWNEEEALATIRSIMDHYIGAPPASVKYDGKTFTPKEFLTYTGLKPNEYVDFMSLMEKPYWQQAEYDVPDNWWNDDSYYNVPLDDFMSSLKTALDKGYSISIGGDVSEAGTNSELGVAMVPTFDIPSEYIDEKARQFRFSNRSTTDDHAMHLVGYKDMDNGTWFLIKDSGSGGHNNKYAKGFWFYHEDFVKLKMMSFTVHKDAVKKTLQRFPEVSQR